MSIAVCILAKDEGAVIAQTLAYLAEQSFIVKGDQHVDIHLVANGCTDHTVSAGQQAAHNFAGTLARLHIHDLQPGGKSRAWNTAVHELIDPSVRIVVFVDADITFAHNAVIENLISELNSSPGVEVCSGFPVKDLSTKRVKSPLDIFSLAISSRTRHVGVINGSLYAGRAECLRSIWLPNETPGEDGFLNAMVATRGFTQAAEPKSVKMADTPTHYYQAHSPLQFVDHERRMIVGTVINRWIFEYLWGLELRMPAGRLIAEWNRDDPQWVENIIRQRRDGRAWLIPNAITFGRLQSNKSVPIWKRVAGFPLALAATLLTLPPAIRANRRLKALGAGRSW